MALAPVPPPAPPEPGAHQCCMCGKRDDWRSSWIWYGSYKDLDDGKPVKKFCSRSCAEKAAEEHGTSPVPSDIEMAADEAPPKRSKR